MVSRGFDSLWSAAVQESSPDPMGAAGELISALANRLEVEQVQYEKIHDAALFLLDLSPLGFTGFDINVVMVTHPPRTDEHHQSYAELLTDYHQRILKIGGFCFHLVLGPESPGFDRSASAMTGVVSLFEGDVGRLFHAPHPDSVMYGLIRNQIPLLDLCPFNTTLPAQGAMFIGRKQELHRLTTDLQRSYLVSGARRIGKTSLLQRAISQLHNRRGFRDRAFYFYARNWNDWRDAVRRIAEAIEPKGQLRVELSPKNLTKILDRQSTRRGRPMPLFLDELDNLVRIDHAAGWPFFGILAEAMEARAIRLVCAGYRDVLRLSRDSTSPLCQKLEDLALSPLSHAECSELIQRPLENLGFQLRPREDVMDHVWFDTAGFPFMVQFFGKELFDLKAGAPGAAITPQDVERIANDSKLIDFIYEHFLENTRSGGVGQAAERACCFLLVEQLRKDRGGGVHLEWDEGTFARVCHQHDFKLSMDEVHESLRNLSHSAILRESGGKYHFAFPLIPKTLKRKFSTLSEALKMLRGA